MFLNGIVAYDERLDGMGGLGKGVFSKVGKGLKRVARVIKKSPGHRLTTKLLKKLPGAKRIEKRYLKKLGKSKRFRKLLIVAVAAVVTYFTFGIGAQPMLAWVASNAKMLAGLASVAMQARNKKQRRPGDPEVEQAAAEGEVQIRDELRAAGYSSRQADQAIANLRTGMDPASALSALGAPELGPPPPAGPRLTPEQVVGETTTEVMPSAPAQGAPAQTLIRRGEPEYGNLIETQTPVAPAAARVAVPATPAGAMPAWVIPAALTAGFGVIGAMTDAFKRR